MDEEKLKKELNTIFVVEDFGVVDMIIEVVKKHLDARR